MIHNQTLHQMPFLRLLLPLASGMSFQYFSDDSRYFYAGFILSVFIFLLSLFLKNKFNYRWVFGLSLTIFCLSGGGWLMHQTLLKTVWEPPENTSAIVYGTLMDYPSEKNKTVLCRMQLFSLLDNEDSKVCDKKVIVYLPKDSLSLNLRPGDKIVFRCAFKPLISSEVDSGFNYNLYLKKQGYAATGFVKKKQWEQVAHTSGLRSVALQCRMHLLSTMKELNLSDKSYALGAAILLGYKDLIDTDMKTSFSASGMAHLIAISGLHVQTIFIILLFLCSFMGNRRKSRIIRQLLVLVCIWIFAFVTGLSPSVVRAATMLTLYGVGEMFGKRTVTLNIVFASAVLMLLYEPLYLFDVSFQLSYAAVLSIIIIYPMLEGLHETKNPFVRYVWASLCVSLAAQLGATPLCLYYFHQFPTHFWLANMLAVPVVGFLLIGIVISVAVQSVVVLPAFVYLPVEYTLRYIREVAETVSGLPFSLITGISLDGIQVFLYYGMLFFALVFVRTRHVTSIYLFQLFLLLQVIYYL